MAPNRRQGGREGHSEGRTVLYSTWIRKGWSLASIWFKAIQLQGEWELKTSLDLCGSVECRLCLGRSVVWTNLGPATWATT